MDSFDLHGWTLPESNIDTVRQNINNLSLQFEDHIELKKKSHLLKIQQYEEEINNLKISVESLQKTIKERELMFEGFKKELPNIVNKNETLIKEMKTLQQKNQSTEKELNQAELTHESLQEQFKQKSMDYTKEQRILSQEKQRKQQQCLTLMKRSGLKIVPLKKNNLKFEFKSIDEKDPDKLFSISLNLDNNKYTVLECEPMIPELDNLVEDLEQHGDPFLFIKLIRQQFCKLASSIS